MEIFYLKEGDKGSMLAFASSVSPIIADIIRSKAKDEECE